MQQTTEVHLPREAELLARYDRFRTRIEGLVDMPERTMDLLFRFLHQNGGTLSRRARRNLRTTDSEAAAAEAAYGEIFQAALNERRIARFTRKLFGERAASGRGVP